MVAREKDRNLTIINKDKNNARLVEVTFKLPVYFCTFYGVVLYFNLQIKLQRKNNVYEGSKISRLLILLLMPVITTNQCSLCFYFFLAYQQSKSL